MRARKKPGDTPAEKRVTVTDVKCVSHCTVVTSVFVDGISMRFDDPARYLSPRYGDDANDECYRPRLIFSVQAPTKDEAEAAVCKAKQKLIERLLA